MADVRFNAQTGEAVVFDGSQWVPTRTAKNRKTGAVVAFDGADWVPVGNSEFASRAASMDPTSLSVARSKNDAFGEYLRQQAMQERPGETENERFIRLYGGKVQDRPGQGEVAVRSGLQGIVTGKQKGLSGP